MGVVKVNGYLISQIVQAAVFFEMVKQDVLQRCGNEEVFLPQAQLASRRSAVVWVQHPGYILETILEFCRSCVISRVEGVQVDLGRCTGFPESQGADPVGAMAGDHVVIGARFDGFGSIPFGPFAMVLGGSTKANGKVGAWSRKFPRSSIDQPLSLIHI